MAVDAFVRVEQFVKLILPYADGIHEIAFVLGTVKWT